MTRESVPIAAVVLARDEEANISQCLDSLLPAAQILVVDSGSTDNTRELARAAGAGVVEKPWLGYARQRNWALESGELNHDWVLFVDADERVPPAAWAEIRRFLDEPNASAGSFRRCVFFLGQQLRHGGFGTARVTRLLRRGARYADRPVHEHPLIEGRVHRFTSPLVHDDQRPFEAWLARHNRYSTLETEARLGAGFTPSGAVPLGVRIKDAVRRKLWRRLPAKPLLFFLYVYLVRGGFLDGWTGLRIASLYGFQELCVQIKLEAFEAAGKQGSGT